jgi:hypothetical protein
VIPTFHWRYEDRVYWHGSAASRMLRANAAGGEVCLTVTLLDAWVLARTSFNHSANYRSVLCYGRPSLVEDANEKLAAMKGFVERLFPGRWDRLRPPCTLLAIRRLPTPMSYPVRNLQPCRPDRRSSRASQQHAYRTLVGGVGMCRGQDDRA